jgi:hypothetical protein
MIHLTYPFEPTLQSLTLHVTRAQLPSFFQFLQRGFFFGALVGCSIRALLCEQLGLDEQYVSERITTVFLDGKPVDDIDSVIVREGSVLSLSAAMPGLVGAAMRRGGRYAFLRDSITQQETAGPGESKAGVVQMRLFNMVMEELGPSFLEKGIIVQTSELIKFFGEQPEEFWGGCKLIALDGIPLESGRIKDGSSFSSGAWLMLSAVTSQESRCP